MMSSLILSSGISTLADPDTEMEKYIDLALIASIETGIISLLMGVFKLGFIVDWVSPTVVSGSKI
jgi:SulP family sulfate permease